MKKRRNWGLILFLLVLIVLYIIIYVVPSVPGLFTKTYVAEFGELEVYDEVEGFFVRTEKVYLAVQSGSVRRLIDEDSLLRAGTPAVEVSGGEAPEVSEEMQAAMDRLGANGVISGGYGLIESGLVSFYFDGYEGSLDLERARSANYKYFDEIEKNSVIKLSGESVREGYPVFKVIKNDKWYVILYVDPDHLDRYMEGRTAFLSLERDGEHYEVEMDVLEKSAEGDRGKVILESENYLPGLGALRRTDVKVETSRTTGLLIKRASLVEKDGVQGVYIIDKTDKQVFYPVNILDSNDDTCVISSSSYYDAEGNYVYTIDPFDDVLLEPEENREGKEE